MVWEDIDANGSQDLLSGEMGIANWPVDLIWNGQVIASTMSGSDGKFVFSSLGNTTYDVCLGPAPVGYEAYNRTWPVGSMASGCSGSGYEHTFTGTFMTRWVVNFGWQLQ